MADAGDVGRPGPRTFFVPSAVSSARATRPVSAPVSFRAVGERSWDLGDQTLKQLVRVNMKAAVPSPYPSRLTFGTTTTTGTCVARIRRSLS